MVEKYRSELINQAFAILGNREDAEDVVQQTFIDAFRDAGRLTQAESMGAWLKSLNRCNALNRLRQKRQSNQKVVNKQEQQPEQTFTTGGFSRIELWESLNQAIKTLPPRSQKLIKLRYWEHLSYKEAAARLKIPESTAKYQLFVATVQLYAKLNVQFDFPSPPSS